MHDDIIFIAAAEKEGGTSHFPMVKSESLGCIVASFEHVVFTKYHMHWFNQTNATYCGTNCDPPFLPSSDDVSLLDCQAWVAM